MNPRNRKRFDSQVEWVLSRFPHAVVRILEEVPLHVLDQPSKKLLKELEVDSPEELCGYFCGLPYLDSSVYITSESLPNSITIFRRGILASARDESGKILISSLREQIRITILHELAHLHGMDEEEIDRIGYG